MSFGGGDQTVTTKYQMSPEQSALIKPAIPIAKDYLKNPPALPDYSQIAGFTPAELAAQSSLIGSYLPATATAGAANTANQFLLSPDILNPNSNPALAATIDAAVRPIQENLTETALPAIRGEFNTAGQFGGSRQGIAEAAAVRDANRQIGDTAAGIATQGYQSGLDAMAKGLALTPSTLQSLLQPGATLSAVGEEQRNMNQAQLSEQAYRDLYSQIAPFLAAQEVAALGAGIPGGSTSTTAPGPSSNPLSTGIGLVSSLASLFGGGGSAAIPTLVGAGLF
jgi:hypothetical protein